MTNKTNHQLRLPPFEGDRRMNTTEGAFDLSVAFNYREFERIIVDNVPSFAATYFQQFESWLKQTFNRYYDNHLLRFMNIFGTEFVFLWSRNYQNREDPTKDDYLLAVWDHTGQFHLGDWVFEYEDRSQRLAQYRLLMDKTHDFTTGKLCTHKNSRELSQEECRERNISHLGMCWHVYCCLGCGHVWSVDSSD